MNVKRISFFLWLIYRKRKHCLYIPNVRLFLAVYLVILWFKNYCKDRLNVQTNVKYTQLSCTLIPGGLATLASLCILIRKEDTTYLQMLVWKKIENGICLKICSYCGWKGNCEYAPNLHSLVPHYEILF